MNKSIYKLFENIVKDLPQVKYFGMFRNQFNNITKEREIDYPAILLEIMPITFNQQMAWNQYAEVSVTLHIGMQIVNNIETGDKMLDNSFDIIELIDDINDKLDGAIGWDDPNSGTTSTHVAIGCITRSSQQQITKINSIWYARVNYSFPMVVAAKTASLTSKIVTDITVSSSGYTSL